MLLWTHYMYGTLQHASYSNFVYGPRIYILQVNFVILKTGLSCFELDVCL